MRIPILFKIFENFELLFVTFLAASSHDMPAKFEVIKPIHLHPKRNRRDLSTREKVHELIFML